MVNPILLHAANSGQPELTRQTAFLEVFSRHLYSCLVKRKKETMGCLSKTAIMAISSKATYLVDLLWPRLGDQTRAKSETDVLGTGNSRL